MCNGANGTPNLTGRFLEGVTSASAAKQTKDAGLPNIKGEYSADDFTNDVTVPTCSGPFYTKQSNKRDAANGEGDPGYLLGFDASRCSSIYGKSTTVQPNSYTVMYIMKIKA